MIFCHFRVTQHSHGVKNVIYFIKGTFLCLSRSLVMVWKYCSHFQDSLITYQNFYFLPKSTIFLISKTPFMGVKDVKYKIKCIIPSLGKKMIDPGLWIAWNNFFLYSHVFHIFIFFAIFKCLRGKLKLINFFDILDFIYSAQKAPRFMWGAWLLKKTCFWATLVILLVLVMKPQYCMIIREFCRFYIFA